MGAGKGGRRIKLLIGGRGMKKGTILKNNWAGYETYFINMNFPVRVGKAEAKAIGGYSITNIDGEWKFRRANYYINSLKDAEAFPIVGHVDLEKACVDAILQAIFGELQQEVEG